MSRYDVDVIVAPEREREREREREKESFAWGHIKTQVNKVKIMDLQHLRERISAAVYTITPAMLQRVFRCTEERWYLCLDMEGNHVERQ